MKPNVQHWDKPGYPEQLSNSKSKAQITRRGREMRKGRKGDAYILK